MSDSKLPNVWLYGGQKDKLRVFRYAEVSVEKQAVDDALYIPAARIRELVEKWRTEADPMVSDDERVIGQVDKLLSCADELAELLEDGK